MDLGELDNLHEAGLLHCMGMRYCGGHRGDKTPQITSWYSTFIGTICITTNPFAPQKAWKNTFTMQDYLDSEIPVMQNKALQPHPWSVADMCYNELLSAHPFNAVLAPPRPPRPPPDTTHAAVRTGFKLISRLRRSRGKEPGGANLW